MAAKYYRKYCKYWMYHPASLGNQIVHLIYNISVIPCCFAVWRGGSWRGRGGGEDPLIDSLIVYLWAIAI